MFWFAKWCINLLVLCSSTSSSGRGREKRRWSDWIIACTGSESFRVVVPCCTIITAVRSRNYFQALLLQPTLVPDFPLVIQRHGICAARVTASIKNIMGLAISRTYSGWHFCSLLPWLLCLAGHAIGNPIPLRTVPKGLPWIPTQKDHLESTGCTEGFPCQT